MNLSDIIAAAQQQGALIVIVNQTINNYHAPHIEAGSITIEQTLNLPARRTHEELYVPDYVLRRQWEEAHRNDRMASYTGW